jgi:hypothetical protein
LLSPEIKPATFNNSNSVFHSKSCFIGNKSFIGFQAIVHDSVIGSHCYSGIGAIVVGVEIPDGRYVPHGIVVDSLDKVEKRPLVTDAHLNFNEDYSTLIEEKGNIIKYLNEIEEVLDITLLNEGKFDIYIKNNMIVKLNIDMYIDSRLHDYWEIDVEKIILLFFLVFLKKMIYIYI